MWACWASVSYTHLDVYKRQVCSAASAVATGAADMSCDAANVRASVVAALELLSTKRAARLPKKHGNMAL